MPEETVRLPRDTVEEAVTAYHHERQLDFHIAVPEAQALYEDPARTVNVSIDDVGMVKQIPQRRRPGDRSAQNTPPEYSGSTPRYPDQKLVNNRLKVEGSL